MQTLPDRTESSTCLLMPVAQHAGAADKGQGQKEREQQNAQCQQSAQEKRMQRRRPVQQQCIDSILSNGIQKVRTEHKIIWSAADPSIKLRIDD